jgi:hypothetical protein
MKAIPFLCLLALLTACGAPNPLAGLERIGRASAGGHDFRVAWNAGAAKATRMNPAFLPARGAVAIAAVAATEEVTGCAVSPGSVRGDAALMSVRLRCPP